jgi:hypothetical protein
MTLLILQLLWSYHLCVCSMGAFICLLNPLVSCLGMVWTNINFLSSLIAIVLALMLKKRTEIVYANKDDAWIVTIWVCLDSTCNIFHGRTNGFSLFCGMLMLKVLPLSQNRSHSRFPRSQLFKTLTNYI